MKKGLFRALLLSLALLFVLQTGAFSVAAATAEEIAQYEHDLALYNAWKAYDEQEQAFYDYSEYMNNGGAEQHEAYLQYQIVKNQAEILDYIFVKDSRGWALIESIDIGVSVVTQFAADPDNKEESERWLAGDLGDVLREAGSASTTLQSLFSDYRKIYNSTYASTHAGLKERYKFYKDNYSSLLESSWELYDDLFGLYDDGTIRIGIQGKENRNGMDGRYVKLVSQLYVFYNCLDDDTKLDPSVGFDYPIVHSPKDLLEPRQIMTDTNQANPANRTFPDEEVFDCPEVKQVEKPVAPTEPRPEPFSAPTPPEGYTPGGSGGGGGGGGSGGGGGGGSGGGGGGGGDAIPQEPVEEIGRSYATESELKENLIIGRASVIKDRDAEVILSTESESALLAAGVKSVALSVTEAEEGDLIAFKATGGKLADDAQVFRLVLSDGDNEDYRYAYFRKDGEAWEALSGESANLSLGDEVLRRESYYLRPTDEVDGENCNLKSLPVSALPGELVKINPQCAFGYEIANLVVKTKDGEEIFVDSMEFVMPYGAVTISFDVLKILYHVQFFVDGVLVAERDYGLGEEIVPPEIETILTKEADDEYQYTFLGWSLEQKTAVGDERELRAEARFAKTRERRQLHNILLKSILLFGFLLLAIATGIFLLIWFLRKRKKKQAGLSRIWRTRIP